MHKAVDHDNHAKHAHCKMRTALYHLAAGGTGEDFLERYGCKRQRLMLPIKVEDSGKAGDVGNAGCGSYACYLKVQDNDEEYVEHEVDDVAGKSSENGDAHVQRSGEPALCSLKNKRQRHNPDQQTVIALQHRCGRCIGVEEQKRRAPDWFLQNDKQEADAEGCQHTTQKCACEQLGVVVPHRLSSKAASGNL